MSITGVINGWFAKAPVVAEHTDRDDRENNLVESGDFKLDLASRRAQVRGRELQLSSAEFDLLHFLLSHPKKLVTPQTVLSTNGGVKAIRRAEFMKTLLSLRQKLDDVSAGEHYLRTEPWVLYSFSPAG